MPRGDELTRQPQVFPVHKFRRRVMDVLFLGGTQGEQDYRKGVNPIGGVWQGADSFLQASVEAFHHAVGLWVVGSGALTCRSEEGQ